MTGTSPNSPGVTAADPSKPHILRVGVPGAGKSTVGAMGAAKLGRPFLDFDTEIVRRQGKPISPIFGELGEGGADEGASMAPNQQRGGHDAIAEQNHESGRTPDERQGLAQDHPQLSIHREAHDTQSRHERSSAHSSRWL